MRKYKSIAFLVVLSMLVFCSFASAQDFDLETKLEKKTSISVYGGILTPQAASELYMGPTSFEDQSMVALSVIRELLSVGETFGVSWLEPLILEAEGIGAYHWGSWPEAQDHGEFVAALNLRWTHFPWKRYLLTTVAFGEGLSYATALPEYEVKIINNSNQLLNYLMLEATFAHPDLPAVALMFRWHHRSGIFGLINDVSGGANFFTTGLRYSF